MYIIVSIYIYITIVIIITYTAAQSIRHLFCWDERYLWYPVPRPDSQGCRCVSAAAYKLWPPWIEKWYPLVIQHSHGIDGPFIEEFPIKPSIYEGFSMAMLNNQMVTIWYQMVTHRNRWFTYSKLWFSMAMWVITRWYFHLKLIQILQVTIFVDVRGAQGLIYANGELLRPCVRSSKKNTFSGQDSTHGKLWFIGDLPTIYSKPAGCLCLWMRAPSGLATVEHVAKCG